MSNLKQTKHVRVIDTTFGPNKETRMLVGSILKVKDIHYFHKTFELYSNDEGMCESYFFNFSDVQEVFPEAVVDGYVLGVGDKHDDGEVVDCYLYDKQPVLLFEGKAGTTERAFSSIQFKDITPLYTPKKETVERKIEELDAVTSKVGDLYVVTKINELVKAINIINAKDRE